MGTNKWFKLGVAIFTFLFFSVGILEMNAFARAGGGRSFGSRGSRSYSQPTSSPARQQAAMPARQMSNPAQAAAPSMWKSMAMGVAGGFLGSMLFSSLGRGMGGGFGGGGFGIMEIILLIGAIYGIYWLIKRRKQKQSAPDATCCSSNQGSQSPYEPQTMANNDTETGLDHIRQMDANFDEDKFRDMCMDNFFKIQGCWINRDMSGVKELLTNEMFGILQKEADILKAEKKINKLDNIAVRSVEIIEAWQEGGMDFITVKLLASLLDYTISEAGELLSGSKTEPVKFEEFWTFTRLVGNNKWQMSAINQA
ncbi:MAG: Tim44 domain-containing protein [Deltaproteobacteria bacterium]